MLGSTENWGVTSKRPRVTLNEVPLPPQYVPVAKVTEPLSGRCCPNEYDVASREKLYPPTGIVTAGAIENGLAKYS